MTGQLNIEEPIWRQRIMPLSDRTSKGQRAIDCGVGVLVASIGVNMIIRWANGTSPSLLGHILFIVWAILLAGSGCLILVGAILRTTMPGPRQSAGFGCELGGWGASGFLIFWYAAISFHVDNDYPLLEVLLLTVVMLLGSWRRLLLAMKQAREEMRHRR